MRATDDPPFCPTTAKTPPPARKQARRMSREGQVRQNNPTGKSLRIFGIRVKLKISKIQKYFAFPERQSSAHCRHPVPARATVLEVAR
jgi:hypothetical protein